MNTLNKWRAFWNAQDTPLHYGNTDEWYRRFAEEINGIFDSIGYSGGSVLESGCGNGALFEFLHINKDEYLGVDLSISMLKIFHAKFPEVKLICADASSFYTSRRFQLIFSNGLVQYFDRKMLRRYIRKSYDMLDRGGSLVIANVPWKDLRLNYLSGILHQKPVTQKGRWIKTLLAYFRDDSMGFWYNPQDFFGFSRLGFEITLFGSLYHPYRFSIVLRKKE